MTTNSSSNTFKQQGHIVIVGASLAGLRAAETLSREGFTGHLTIIGDEPYEPYDRPPLSKQVLAGRLPVEHLPLARLQTVEAEWKLGVAATGLDLADRKVILADGQHVPFDRLLITTGSRARPWPQELGGNLDGVFVVRNRDDASKLRQRLETHPRRVLIIGGGFIGCEVAGVCHELDLPVTLVERGPTPLLGSLGATIGSIVANLQRRNGIDLRDGVTVARLEGDEKGMVRRAVLSDGGTIEADVVVIALGALLNAEWLHDSGLSADTRGVLCDNYCRVLDTHNTVADGIFVAGDVARWSHPLRGDQAVAVEHWGNAVEQAETAAHNILSAPDDYRTYQHLPAIWSHQFDINIKTIGFPELADEVIITQGSPDRGRFAAAYGRNGRVIGAVAFNMARWLDLYREMIEAQAPYPPVLNASDAPQNAQSQPARFPERNPRVVATNK
jgi:3-phenylpropionate/trans-cinnamate dioxygenase ferredoxin reductase component